MFVNDVVKMMNLIRFFIKEYRQSEILSLFSSNSVWNREFSKSIQGVTDLIIFERWLIAFQIIYPNSFEGLESIIDVDFKEFKFDFRNNNSYNNSR